jgi:hypothetical protein
MRVDEVDLTEVHLVNGENIPIASQLYEKVHKANHGDGISLVFLIFNFHDNLTKILVINVIDTHWTSTNRLDCIRIIYLPQRLISNLNITTSKRVY